MERWEVAHVEALLDALRPLPWYARHLGPQGIRARLAGGAASGQRPYDADTPLQRPVDWTSPESPASRRVDALVAALRDDPDDVLSEVALRDYAHRWRMAEHALTPLMTRAPVFEELEVLAADLALVADLLDEAVDALVGQHPVPARVLAELDDLAAEGRSSGDLELAVLDGLLSGLCG